MPRTLTTPSKETPTFLQVTGANSVSGSGCRHSRSSDSKISFLLRPLNATTGRSL